MVTDKLVEALRPYSFRGKLRLLDWLVPESGERTASIFGAQTRLDLSDSIQRWIYMGVFEPGETARVREWLRPGMTFLDVGANVGYFSLLAAARVGAGGRVYAIEPSPYAFNRLRDTAEANGLAQICPRRLGLSDAAGELTLYVQRPGEGFHSPTMSAESGGDPVPVPVRRLDDLLDEWDADRVDLMKLDVEGHELHVLRGGPSALRAGRVRALLCELNDHWLRAQGSSAQELYQAILDLGFADTEAAPKLEPGTFETRFFVHRSGGVPAEGLTP